MRKTIIITSLILSGLLILDSMSAGHFLMMFLLAGIIPGTNIAISAQNMMEGFALVGGFVIARIMSNLLRIIFAHLPRVQRAA
ncbi:MAG: hypothetical protein WA030_03800 [Candidatus Microsaccharimonas sp.]